MIRMAPPSITFILFIYQWLNLFSFILWDRSEKEGMKDDSRKPAKPQKSTGHRGNLFSECRRKAGVFRSLSEASSGEDNMKWILSPACRIHWAPSIHAWSGPFDRSEWYKHWGKPRQIGQIRLSHPMLEPQYHFSLSLQISMDWTSKMRQGMQILGQKVLKSRRIKQYNRVWDHEAKSKLSCSTNQFPTHQRTLPKPCGARSSHLFEIYLLRPRVQHQLCEKCWLALTFMQNSSLSTLPWEGVTCQIFC